MSCMALHIQGVKSERHGHGIDGSDGSPLAHDDLQRCCVMIPHDNVIHFTYTSVWVVSLLSEVDFVVSVNKT